MTAVFFYHRHVTESIRHLCKFSMHNAMLCSTSGVFSKVVKLLESDAQNIDNFWAGIVRGYWFFFFKCVLMCLVVTCFL